MVARAARLKSTSSAPDSSSGTEAWLSLMRLPGTPNPSASPMHSLRGRSRIGGYDDGQQTLALSLLLGRKTKSACHSVPLLQTAGAKCEVCGAKRARFWRGYPSTPASQAKAVDPTERSGQSSGSGFRRCTTIKKIVINYSSFMKKRPAMSDHERYKIIVYYLYKARDNAK